MISYIKNKPVPVKAIADLRQSVGWNRMESINNQKYGSSVGFELR